MIERLDSASGTTGRWFNKAALLVDLDIESETPRRLFRNNEKAYKALIEHNGKGYYTARCPAHNDRDP